MPSPKNVTSFAVFNAPLYSRLYVESRIQPAIGSTDFINLHRTSIPVVADRLPTVIDNPSVRIRLVSFRLRLPVFPTSKAKHRPNSLTIPSNSTYRIHTYRTIFTHKCRVPHKYINSGSPCMSLLFDNLPSSLRLGHTNAYRA